MSRARRSKEAISTAAFLALILCTACSATAQGPTRTQISQPVANSNRDPAQEVEAFIERLRAESHVRNRNLRKGQSPSKTSAARAEDWLPHRLAVASPEVQEAALAVLAAQAQPLERDLRKAAADLDQGIRELASAWELVRAKLYRQGALLERYRNAASSSKLYLWSLDDHWFWVAVLLPWAALAACIVHAHRHAIRRRWGIRLNRAARRGIVLGGIVLIMGLVAGLGFLDRLTDARKTANLGGHSLEAATNKGLDATEGETQKLPSGVFPSELSPTALGEGAARLNEKDARLLPRRVIELGDRVWEVVERFEVLDFLPRGIQEDLEHLQRRDAELRQAAAKVAPLNRWRRGIRGVFGLGSLLGVATGAWFLRLQVKRREAKASTTCPLCLGVIPGAAASQNGQPGDATALVRCDNALDSAGNIRCGFVMRDAYRRMPRLCFPTLGLPRAGKTHWLAMTYWQLNRGAYPRWVRFQRVRPVEIATSEDLDRVVEQILISRLGTSATQLARLPHPVMLQFTDCDLWGRSTVLVNLFDFSGEVSARVNLDDYRRRRALEADGYAFFLDPTLPADPQAKALANLCEDLRLMKGWASRDPIPIPLAVCVSKIDLLVRQPFALTDGDDAVAHFYEALARIDPTGEAMTLEVLRARSRLVADLSATIWPGWDIQRTLDDAFRGHWMFFPLTPVGLDGRGETDLSLRTIAPFGLLEPLAWLLHMNGYPVLM